MEGIFLFGLFSCCSFWECLFLTSAGIPALFFVWHTIILSCIDTDLSEFYFEHR